MIEQTKNPDVINRTYIYIYGLFFATLILTPPINPPNPPRTPFWGLLWSALRGKNTFPKKAPPKHMYLFVNKTTIDTMI